MEAELIVSAATSLTNSLEEVKQLFEQKYPETTVTYNFASSGVLQHQIEHGAPVDIFFSAGKKQMDHLIDAELIDQKKTVNLVGNELVVIVPEGEGDAWDNLSPLLLTSIRTIAIGETHTVPAGEYAKAALVTSEMWNKMINKIVYAKDARQVLSYVETGNVDAGIAYKSDAMSSDNVRIAFIIDAKTHDVIEYPLGIVNNSNNPQAAKEFYNYLQSPEALDIFEKYGFMTN